MTQARPAARVVLVISLLALALTGFGLAAWQVQRRAWKHALIEAVDSRSSAAPVAAPGPDQWSRITQQRDAYRRVTVTGRFAHDRETLVHAVTEHGSGYWVLTPLMGRHFTVLVNRGFVPPDRRDPATRAAGDPAGIVRVTGLLRISEPGGGFLRDNDPQAGRWYSRDIAAIAGARGLKRTAPYFIDADGTPNVGGYPVGGLTVIRFSDNHAVYAFTWLALALGCLFAAKLIWQRP